MLAFVFRNTRQLYWSDTYDLENAKSYRNNLHFFEYVFSSACVRRNLRRVDLFVIDEEITLPSYPRSLLSLATHVVCYVENITKIVPYL